MKRLIIVGILYCLMLAAIPAQACTLFAAAGDRVVGGGTLIVKNRDWLPDNYQEMYMVTPEDGGYRYYGIIPAGNNQKGVKAGINEYGLVAITASTSSLSPGLRGKERGTTGKYLANCKTVDEVLAKKDLFTVNDFAMFADREKIAEVEVGPGGVVSVKVTENGAFYHANHYVHDDMLQWNTRAISKSSAARYSRIKELIDGAKQPFTPEDFIKFAADQTAGPDNSLWRTGSTNPKMSWTLSTWMVVLAPDKDPMIYVRLADPGSPERTGWINAADIFR